MFAWSRFARKCTPANINPTTLPSLLYLQTQNSMLLWTFHGKDCKPQRANTETHVFICGETFYSENCSLANGKKQLFYPGKN